MILELGLCPSTKAGKQTDAQWLFNDLGGTQIIVIGLLVPSRTLFNSSHMTSKCQFGRNSVRGLSSKKARSIKTRKLSRIRV
jgi:hypothetical protein